MSRTPEARRMLIAELVVERGSVHVDDIVSETDVSAMTVYRDLAALERAGILERSRGTVTAVASSLAESSAAFRLAQDLPVKTVLGKVAAGFVPHGSSIMIDDSTTCVQVVRALGRALPVTVVTHCEFIAKEVRDTAGMSLYLAGGRYTAWSDAYHGASTIAALRDLRADVCIMSASAVTGDHVYHPVQEVAEIKHAMLESSARRILVVDTSKFSRRALHRVAGLADFDVVVVDDKLSVETINHIEALGPHTEVVTVQQRNETPIG